MFDTCREYSVDKDDLRIIEKMWTKVKKCDASYTTSQKFLDFSKSVHAKILLNSNNMHLYLKEFYDELSRLPTSKKSNPKSAQNGPHTTSVDSEAVAGPSADRSPSEGREPDTTSVENGNEKHIQKLEKLLKKCSKKIKKLELKEMSVDELDEDGSIYLQIDLYKRKCLQIWKKLCELNGEKKAQSGRVLEKKFTYEGSRFPEINKCVSRLVNRSKSFPDFCDIIDLITQCNDQYDLHLRPFQIDTIAREAFRDIGKELKRRRILDYEEHFGCPMLDEENIDNDPASQDEVLDAKLVENKNMGKKKEAEIFESFVLKQVELDSQPHNPEGSESQNDEGSEEEDTEKEAPLDVVSGGDIESESESEREEEVEIVEEAEEELDVDYVIEEEEEEEEEEETIMQEEGYLQEPLEDIDVEYEVADNTVMDVIQTNCVRRSVMSYDHCSQRMLKRCLTPELSIQPLSKRHTASPAKEVHVRVMHNLEDFPKSEDLPDLTNEDSTDSEIFIIE